MIVELLNTAIEKLGDRVSLELDPRMAFVKDLGSAAVGLSLLFAAAVWLARRSARAASGLLVSGTLAFRLPVRARAEVEPALTGALTLPCTRTLHLTA